MRAILAEPGDAGGVSNAVPDRDYSVIAVEQTSPAAGITGGI